MAKPILNYFSDEQNISKDVDISMFFDEKIRDKQGTKQGQTRDKQETKEGQSGDKKLKQETKQGQSRDKQGTKQGQSSPSVATEIIKLRGSQHKILMFFYDICKANNSLKTDPMNLQEISSKLSLKKETVKKSIQRLIDKKIIKRGMYQTGRKSFNIYQFSRIYFNRIRDKQGTNEGARSSSLLYRDNIYLNTTTTTTPLRSVDSVGTFSQPVNIDEKINYDPLKEINITNKHIEKLQKFGIPDITIQESINGLAYDLKNGFQKASNFKISPLAFLMGILLKGEKYIAHMSFYEKERRIVEAMRQRKKELDAIMQNKTKVGFALWLSDLAIDERLEILGLTIKELEKLSKEMQNNMLFSYWKDNIYPFEANEEMLKKS